MVKAELSLDQPNGMSGQSCSRVSHHVDGYREVEGCPCSKLFIVCAISTIIIPL